ncbi:ABC transporter ATP-binding protein [bacterium]|nr:ABC transporter ATP-binding protein [bacterium]
MAEAVIQYDDVVTGYRKRPVIGPISLHVHPGDFWGIIGPNGSGKSTLLRILAGLQPVMSGSIRVLGNPFIPATHREQIAIRKKIGVLLQYHEFFPDLPVTVEDVVLFGRLGLRGIGRVFTTADRLAVEDAVTTLGIGEFRARLYRELSGGEKRKVQLARILAQQPEIILLDEPTAGLDLDWQERLTQLTEDLYHSLGKTIIMVTHDVDRLPSCCNQVLLLKNGRELAAGPPDEVLREDILSRLYGCNIEVHKHRGRYHAHRLGVLE